jgi:hypothetical protein
MLKCPAGFLHIRLLCCGAPPSGTTDVAYGDELVETDAASKKAAVLNKPRLLNTALGFRNYA